MKVQWHRWDADRKWRRDHEDWDKCSGTLLDASEGAARTRRADRVILKANERSEPERGPAIPIARCSGAGAVQDSF